MTAYKRPQYVLRVVSALALALFAGTASPVAAQSATANLNVSATVITNCTISTGALSFGQYDPVVAQASQALDGTGSVSIACTKGTTPTIGLGLGANANGSTRRLKGAGDDYLTYELYHGSAGGTVWGNTAETRLTATTAASRSAVSYTVYGRIAGAQDVPAGAYTDVIVATVNF